MNIRDKDWKDSIYTKTARDLENDHPNRRMYHAVCANDHIEQLKDGYFKIKAIDEDANLVNVYASPKFVDAMRFIGRGSVIVYYKNSGGYYYYDIKPCYEELSLHISSKEALITYLLTKDDKDLLYHFFLHDEAVLFYNYNQLSNEDKLLYLDTFIIVNR